MSTPTRMVALGMPPELAVEVGSQIDYAISPVYSSFTQFGGATTNTIEENLAAFTEADATGLPVYLPPGHYVTSTSPYGKYFGPGTIQVNAVTFYFDPIVATRPRVGSSGGSLLWNLSIGQQAGENWEYGVHSSVALGSESQRYAEDGERSTSVGWRSLGFCTTPLFSEAFGAGAFQWTKYSDRSGAFGANAGKWAGDEDPVLHNHDFFQNAGTDTVRDPLWSDWRSVVGPMGGPSLYAAEDDDDNYGNLYFGRDTGDHAVIGNRNTAFGYHAFEGWIGKYNCLFGASAGELSLTNEFMSGFGYATLNSKMTGDMDCAFGAYSLKFLVHGGYNSVFGSESFYSLTGGSDDKATADAASVYNVGVGYRSAYNLIAGTRNTFIGSLAASSLTAGSFNATLGYETLNNVTIATLAVAVGYNAGVSNADSLSNTICVGANTGGLLASNTAKFGNDISHATVSGRLYSTTLTETISTAGDATLTALNVVNNPLVRTGTGASTDTVPTAAQLVALIPGCEDNTTIRLWLVNNRTGTVTLAVPAAAGHGITLSGTTTVPTLKTRFYMIRITSITPGSCTAIWQGVGLMDN
jgi:hypothetical protein